ncbi:hypothetical protein GDO86_019223 [Hymenochirus boettgeri]|uniref:Myosin motor domain-containing protein n=1 Tax=Hymenochirus boettgeri TaxID=247094 RepID=A0A8T2IDK8_9PIPI|nr:hypothetical protein GDO86_019223 [Hymenochirus boettgeri]
MMRTSTLWPHQLWSAFIIRHFAGKVKYQIKDFREKNPDYMRPDIVALLRSSDQWIHSGAYWNGSCGCFPLVCSAGSHQSYGST